MQVPRRCLCFLLLSVPAFAQQTDVDSRKTSIISEGTRMAAELFWLKSDAGKRLPTIVMCHGWGGVAASLRRDAVAFARAGYFAVTFDYRGWGESDSRIILTRPAPAERPNRRFTAEVQEVREVVDPLDMTTDLLNALHWVQAEPQCDTGRIGLWGSSFSGGHVVYAAARDHRVKALVSQVPALDARFVVANDAELNKTYEDATRMARGDQGYPAPGARVIGNLRGAPVRSRFMHYAPVEDADKAPQCAMLFLIAEKEELFDNRDHAIKAHARAKGPKKLVTIPGITHYGVYMEARQQAQKLAIEWFDQYLKSSSRPSNSGRD
jgi:dienelactone hydrolase